MKILDHAQGSDAWRLSRCGLPTASCADMILTPSELKASKSWDRYMGRLVAEWFLGKPLDEAASQFMDRGTALEPEARKWYAFDRGGKVQAVGLCLTDDGTFGASPDSLVDDDGSLEIKCPGAVAHGVYMVSPAKLRAEHYGQVQAQLFVTRRAWTDLIAFNPVMPAVVVRVEPDPAYQAAFGPALAGFVAALATTRAKWSADRDSYMASLAEAAQAEDDQQPF